MIQLTRYNRHRPAALLLTAAALLLATAAQAQRTTTIGGSVYGGGSLASVGGSTVVSLTGGTVEGDVYGGGKGRLAVAEVKEGDVVKTPAVEAVEALVAGDVLLTLNGTEQTADDGTKTYPDQCVVKGSIFGCNNLNGTPKGSVTVHICKTAGYEGHRRTDSQHLLDASAEHTYELAAVYGGGNMAAYVPDDLTKGQTRVIIDGCDLTSIRQVYGGGNAASTPATQVTVNGTYEIEDVFGGGNGRDDISVNGETRPNPGANVGYHAYPDDADYDTRNDKNEDRTVSYTYGSGVARVNINGGTTHHVYGGSNTKGNVRQIAVAMLADESGCEFNVDEAYGGGKNAPMDGEARLEMKCIPYMAAVYGGAENADVHNNVELNITNGHVGQVFGGNKSGGTIEGSITINVEETGCRAVQIDELYGGGNEAPYSVYGYDRDDDGTVTLRESGDAPLYADPQVNVKSFTSIGSIFGGGYGENAVMVGSPHVNINVVRGDHAADGTIGTIGTVYGGGNAAKVVGDTYVNVGTETTVSYVTKSDGEETPRTDMPVVGANITGNVYGGGNMAEVTGLTHVTIGRQPADPTPAEPTPAEPTPAEP